MYEVDKRKIAGNANRQLRSGDRMYKRLINGETRPACYKRAFCPYDPKVGVGIICHRCKYKVECSGRSKVSLEGEMNLF